MADVLKQVGGVQNTLKAPSMTGPVVTGVGHTPIVLATGTLLAPEAKGVYTLSVSNVLARVIKQGEDGSGEIWATEWAWQGSQVPLTLLVAEDACASLQDCADENGDGVRDEPCLWWACSAGVCQSTDIVFADVGGQFGSCLPDGVADGNDRFHALNCFANRDTDGGPGYPCEDAAPLALNTDPGGPFGDCNPDGICDGNDVFHTLNAFTHQTVCSCSGGPSPQTGPQIVGMASLSLRTRKSRVHSGGFVEVDAFLDQALPDLRGYQLHLDSRGGERGKLRLVDILVQSNHERYVYAGEKPWRAFNVQTAQMVAGLDGSGLRVEPGAYLATFVYQASADAVGTFVVDILRDRTDPTHRTFLMPTPPTGKIEIVGVAPAVIDVYPVKRSLRP